MDAEQRLRSCTGNRHDEHDKKSQCGPNSEGTVGGVRLRKINVSVKRLEEIPMASILGRNPLKATRSLLGLALLLLVSEGCSRPASAFDALAAKLSDPQQEVRQAAATELARSSDGRALGLLASALADKAASVRLSVVRALGERDDPRAIWPLLRQATREQDDGVLRGLVISLVRLGQPRHDKELVERLTRRLVRLTPRDWQEGKRPALYVFHRICEHACMSYIVKEGLFATESKQGMVTKELASGSPAIQVLSRSLLQMRPKKPIAVIFTPRILVCGLAEAVDVHRSYRYEHRLSEARRRYASRGKAGVVTLDRLEQKVDPSALSGLQFRVRTMETVAAILSKVTGVRVHTDWVAIAEAGGGKSAKVDFPHVRKPRARLARLLDYVELFQSGTELQVTYLVEPDGTLFLSTVPIVEGRLGLKRTTRGRGSP